MRLTKLQNEYLEQDIDKEGYICFPVDIFKTDAYKKWKKQKRKKKMMACTCQKCGKKYKMDLMIPDELWIKIMPSKEGGLLCPACIVKEIEKIKGYSCYKLIKL